jgi:thiol-disulfide isomerase/thioredoxin
MISPRVVALVFLAGTLVAAGVTLISLRSASGATSLRGKIAPPINLKTRTGESLSLAGQKGKVVLIDLWATWCPPCRASLPHIQKIAQDHALAEKGLVVWAINSAETKKQVDAFMAENNYTFTVLMDENDSVSRDYFIEGIPTTIIVGRDGTVKDIFVGYGGETTEKQINGAIAKALAEPAPK